MHSAWFRASGGGSGRAKRKVCAKQCRAEKTIDQKTKPFGVVLRNKTRAQHTRTQHTALPAHTHTMADGPGFDGDDPSRTYATPAELWAAVEEDKQAGWYGQAVAYW